MKLDKEELLKLENQAELPEICLGCTDKSNLTKKIITLRYTHSALFLWLLLSPIAWVIAYWRCHKTLNLSVYWCDECAIKNSKWRKAASISWVVFILSFFAIYFGGKAAAPYPGIVAIVSFFSSIGLMSVASSQLKIAEYIDPYFYVGGFNSSFKKYFKNNANN